MSNIDEFESVFRSALKDRFVFKNIEIKKISIVTDFNKNESLEFAKTVKDFLGVLEYSDEIDWQIIDGSDYKKVVQLLSLLENESPDLICTYRNLHSEAWNFPYSLGDYVDVLTQRLNIPVFIMPHPNASYKAKHALQHTKKVMVITDHLTTDTRLVNYAINLIEEKGILSLVHIEDENYFNKFIDAVSRIPNIDTNDAKELISKQLLKISEDFMDSISDVLKEEKININIKKFVRFGHHIKGCKRIIDKQNIDLLIMKSKDEDQLAMNGLAYPLAVEVRNIPILMVC